MTSSASFDAVVIGAGASGLCAALAAAQRGARALVLEAGPSAGRKILASGNGRCNLTNINAAPDDYLGGGALVRAALDRLSGKQAVEFFESLGVLTALEGGGRVFPRAGKSTAVLTPLLCAAGEAGVKIETGRRVNSLSREGGMWRVKTQEGPVFAAKNAVLACGSSAAPGLGGSEDGYALAKSLGHRMTPTAPALVPLCVLEKGLKRLAGIRADVSLKTLAGGGAVSTGEALFTNYGISGPAALNLAAACALALPRGPALCEMNLFPEYAAAEFAELFRSRVKTFACRPVKHFFAGFLQETVANLVLDMAGLDRNARADSFSETARAALIRFCTAWKFTVSGTRPLSEAMAMAGGIAAEEIDPQTMQSRLAPGVYAAGELLEPVGRSGGFNLHFAWASGLIAGNSLKF